MSATIPMPPAHVIAEPTRQGAALPPLQRSGTGSALDATQRRLVVGLIVGLHLLAVWGLLQVQVVRDAAVHAAPILVSLLTAPTPPAPPPQLPTPAAKPPRAKPRPVAQPPVIATTASPTPEAITVPPPQEAPAPTTAALQPVSSLASTQPVVAAPPAPPAPKLLPDDAVQYLQAPQLVYPPLSMRRRETGLVVVRAYVGTEGGAPRSVQVERSSGHPRLDQAALSAVQLARFRPYAEKGQPVEGWALIPIRFELEK